jgi:hypothetical protein
VYFGSEDGGEGCHGVTRRDPKCALAPVELKLEAAGHRIPPQNVRRLVKALAPSGYAGPERRMHQRYPVTVPVVALPLAADFRIDGEPLQMTTVNVSLGGAALIHTRFIKAPNLALDFTVAGVELLQVVLKVLRVRGIGPVYEIGGEFISRLSDTGP